MNTYSVSFTFLTVAIVLLGTAVLMIASWLAYSIADIFNPPPS